MYWTDGYIPPTIEEELERIKKRNKPPEFWLLDLFKTRSENQRDLKKKVYRDYGVKFRSSKQAARYLWKKVFNTILSELVVEEPMAPPTNKIFYEKMKLK